MKLEWEECPRPGCLWIGRADGCRYLATSGEEKLKIQGEHNAYIEQIAAANGYIKLEPGQAVVPASALASAIRELRWLASSANLVSPGLWKEENSWTVSEFNNAIRAALEGE